MNLDRRGFIGGLAALIGGLAIQEAIPLGRVWSFPSQIVIAESGNIFLTPTMITREALMILHQKARFVNSIHRQYDHLQIRMPDRYE